MRVPKIIFFIPSFAGGGAERQCVYLVNALSRRGDLAVGLAHFHGGVNYQHVDRASVELFPILTSSNYDPRNVWWVRNLIEKERPDVVFSWLQASDVVTWCVRALGPRFKWVMAERNSWYPPDLRFWIRNAVGARADMIVSNSAKGDQYWAERNVPVERRRVIGNVLPDAWFTSRVARTSGPNVCYAGRLEEQKNVSLLIRSFAHLSLARNDVGFTVIGEGSLRGAVDRIAATGREGAISILPFQHDVRSHFERASVFVNVSLHEGRPNTVIENLALGNRVVLSRIPEHVDLVGANYPFLVDVGVSERDLASVIERALEQPVAEEEYGRCIASLESSRVAYVADQYASLFFELAGSK